MKKAERGEALLQGRCGCELAFRYTVSGVLWKPRKDTY